MRWISLLTTGRRAAVTCAALPPRLSTNDIAKGSGRMFIQTEATPNPATLKFLPDRAVLDEGTFEALDAEQAERSPLAKALMELPGVGGVFLAPDFISVTKTEGEWQHLRPAVLGVVTEFFLSGAPALSGEAAAVTDEF